MVWQKMCPVIVSLNRLVEGGQKKGDPYWPAGEDGSSESYGDIYVTLLSSVECASLETVIRHMRIVNTSEPSAFPRDVFQLHYLGWPDFGVPVSSRPIRELAHLTDMYRYFANNHLQLNGPCVVHCSAGVGRTGSFMSMMCVMENPRFKELRDSIRAHQSTLKDDDIILAISSNCRISDIVLSLREQRNCGTVQTSKQYEFIYLALKDELDEPGLSDATLSIFRSFPAEFNPARLLSSSSNPRSSPSSVKVWTCRSASNQFDHSPFPERLNAQQ